GQLFQSVKHFVSRGAMDIEGLGEKQAAGFLADGLIAGVADIYELDEQRLTGREGFGKVSAHNLLAAVERSKQQPFSRVLFGLNIPKVGWVIARNLAEHFGSVDALVAATQSELEEVEGVGPDRAVLIAEWFSDEENQTLVGELRELGIQMVSLEEARPAAGLLTGQQFVITGTLEGLKREEAKSALEALGAKVSESVSGKTTGVIVGEAPGSKAQKAEELGVPILSEADLSALLRAG
ncbi:MAG: helix-hairpin-helix domain-containing protein, partial [Actinomycetota bacterium]|nr:helix-hairpin-helix domain-containing protein [Actinomycetota bacterium]